MDTLKVDDSLSHFLTHKLVYFFPLLLFWTLALPYLQVDFRVFYLAGKSYLLHLDPYINHVGQSIDFFAPVNASFRYASGFKYPPLAAIFFSPVALLPYGLAKQIYVASLGLSFILCVYLLSKLLVARVNNTAILLLSASAPMLASLSRGQADLWVLLLMIVSLLLLCRDKQDMLAGLFYAFACVLKIMPIFLLPVFLMQQRYKFCAWSIAFLLALMGCSWFIFGFTVHQHFLMEILPSIFGHLSASASNLSPALIHQLTTPSFHDHHVYYMKVFNGKLNPLYQHELLSVSVGYALLAIYFILDKHHDKRYKLLTSLNFILIINPITWIMGLVWYFPFFLLSFKRSNTLGKLLLALPLYLPIFSHMNFYLAVLLPYFYAIPKFEQFFLQREGQ